MWERVKKKATQTTRLRRSLFLSSLKFFKVPAGVRDFEKNGGVAGAPLLEQSAATRPTDERVLFRGGLCSPRDLSARFTERC
jgi:hypothetical protein